MADPKKLNCLKIILLLYYVDVINRCYVIIEHTIGIHIALCCMSVNLLHHSINKWCFRPLLSTYRLNWARIASWWWDASDDTSCPRGIGFAIWIENTTSRSWRLSTILNSFETWNLWILWVFPLKPDTRTTDELASSDVTGKQL